MLTFDEAQPFSEDPNPRFGGVIEKMNELTFFVEEKTKNFSGDTSAKLQGFTDALNSFIQEVVVPMDEHINARGPVHGENKATVGLGNKDNFPAATLAQQLAFADVDAFVTVQGAKQAVTENTGTYDKTAYQQNDVLQMSSYYYQNNYPTGLPSTVEIPRYFTKAETNDIYPSILLDSDRLLFTTTRATANYMRNTCFLSGPTRVFDKVPMTEIRNISSTYRPRGWRSSAGPTTARTVNFFRPLPEKKIFDFKNQTTGLAGDATIAYLLFRGYAGATYKGLGVSTSRTGNVVTVQPRFFKVNTPDTDPTLVDLLDATYLASVSPFVGAAVNQPANDPFTVDLAQFISLPAGATLTSGGNRSTDCITLVWNIQDGEAYLMLSVGCYVRYSDNTLKYLTFNVIVSIIPGTLRAGGKAAYSIVGESGADVIPADKSDPVDAKFFTVSDQWDVNSTVHSPGMILDDGTVIKSKTTKYSLKVKKYESSFATHLDWMVGPRPRVPMNQATLTTYVPGRHSPFTSLPDRILPISQSAARTTYLAYGLNLVTGHYGWKEISWATNNLMGNVIDTKTGLKQPEEVTVNNNLKFFPSGMVCFTSTTLNSVVNTALVFTETNGYKSVSTFSYADGVMTLGDPVQLNKASQIKIKGLLPAFLERTKTRRPGINNNLRKPSFAVYVLPANNKALYILSDGLGSVEGAIVSYTNVNGIITLNFNGGMKLATVLLGDAAVVPGLTRESKSGDNLTSEFSDMLIHRTASNNYAVVINRPFGKLYGDISFTITGLNLTVPEIAMVAVNPARLYPGSSAIDVVDELYPAFSIPGKGVWQYDPVNNTDFSTICVNVANPADLIDPLDPNDVGFVVIPAGTKMVINGRSFATDRSYEIQVDPTLTYYLYLIRTGMKFIVNASLTLRESSNNEVMIGMIKNGIWESNTSYIVLNNHVISATRQGGAIPFFADDGANGTNKFFTQRDRI
ncbi:hypothetical protein D3C79_49820 [compost metagenome]